MKVALFKLSLIAFFLFNSAPLFSEPKSDELHDRYQRYLQTLKQGHLIEAEQQIHNLGSQVNGKFLYSKGLIQLSKAYLNKKDYEKSSLLLDRVLSKKPYSAYQKEALILKAQLEYARHSDQGFINAYSTLLLNFPEESSQHFILKKIRERIDVPPKNLDFLKTREEVKIYLQKLIASRYYDQAIRDGALYLDKHGKRSGAEDIYLQVSIAYYLKENYTEARFNIRRVVLNKQEGNPLHRDGLFLFAKILEGLKDFPAAKKAYIDCARLYGKHPYLGPRIYDRLCLVLKKTGSYPELTHYESLFQKKFSNHPYFKEYRWRQTQDILKNTHEAALFENLLTQSITSEKLSDHLMAFYHKQAKLNRFTLGQAFSRFPLSYNTKQSLDFAFQNKKTYEIPVDLKHYLEIISRGFDPLIYEELEDIYSKQPLKRKHILPFLAKISPEKYNNPFLSIETLSQLYTGNEDTASYSSFQLLYGLYPKAYKDLVLQNSKLFSLEANWVWTIMREISQFSSTIENQENRIGLFKLEADIGKAASFRLGDYWTNAFDLMQPSKNIRYACFYLSWLNKQFKDNPFIVLTAMYKSSQSAFLYYKSDRPPISLEEAENQIPYQDLKNIFRRSIDTYIIYSMIYD